MLKYRIAYGMIVAIWLFLLFFTGHSFPLLVSIGLIALAFLFFLLLGRDVRQLVVDYESGSICKVGQKQEITIHIAARHWLFVAGTLKVRIAWYNRMFDREEKREVRIPLRGGRTETGAVCEYVTPLCGQEQIRIERIDCYDILGLCRRMVHLPQEQSVLVYPEPLEIQVDTQKLTQGMQSGEQICSNQKGNDATEIFELRKYQPGDDVRQIHWKLSEKMSELLVKEGSDPSHNSTVLLFDAGRIQEEKPIEESLLLTAVELGMSMSEALMEQGVPHDMMIAVEEDLYRVSVRNQADYTEMQEQWLGRKLQRQANGGIRQFFAQHREQEYARLIYITVEELPREIELSAADIDITVLMLKKDGNEVRAVREKNYQILELPYAYIQEHTCQIGV